MNWQAVQVDRRLLDDGDLTLSAVVANCAMNRERQLAGVNSYTRELGFNPLVDYFDPMPAVGLPVELVTAP